VSSQESPLVFRLLSNGKVGVSDWESATQSDLAWVHLDGWRPLAVQEFLRTQAGLDQALAEDLSLFRFILRFDHSTGRAAAALPCPLDDGETQHGSLLLVCQGSFLITASQEASSFIRSLMEEWVEDPEGIGLTAPDLLCSVTRALALGDSDVVDQIHEKIESLEDSIFEMKTFDASAAVAIKREALELRRRLSQIRDFVMAVSRHGEPWAGQDKEALYLDIGSHVLHQIESLDLARDILSSVMDAQLGIISNRLNDVMRVLTVISTLMMASSLIAGIYGMNFVHLPGSQSWVGFYICLAVMAVTSALILAVFKRRGFL